VCRWNKIFGNNSLTAPISQINFKRSTQSEIQPRPSVQLTPKSRCSLSCSNDDVSEYMQAYRGYLEALKDISPQACIFTAIPKLDSEETDTADSEDQQSGFRSLLV